MLTAIAAADERQQLRNRLLHHRMNLLLSTDLPWIEDIGAVSTGWHHDVRAIRHFLTDRFHGFYKYSEPLLGRVAVVKFTIRGIYELSLDTVGERQVVRYTRFRVDKDPTLMSRDATLDDFIHFLSKFK